MIKLRSLIPNLTSIKLQPFSQHALIEERDDEDDQDGDYVYRDASSDDGDDNEEDDDGDDNDDDDEEDEKGADYAYDDIVSNLPAVILDHFRSAWVTLILYAKVFNGMVDPAVLCSFSLLLIAPE